MRANKLFALAAVLGLTAGMLAGCTSAADRVSDNISKEAERFQVVRSIVGVNGITDKVEFQVVGRCSLEYGDTMKNVLDVICKDGPHDYKKHYISLSDNMFFISTQIRGVNVSEFRTKIILKPENIVPDFDLMTSGG